MNNRSPKPRFSKYKKCSNLLLFIKMNKSKPIKNEKKKKKNENQMSLSMMMVICIKQHLRKI